MTHMATITEQRTVCDVCGSEEDLKPYTLGRGGRPRRVDLCPRHRKPLDAILDKAPPPAPRKPRRAKVVTMDEVEKIKQAEKKK